MFVRSTRPFWTTPSGMSFSQMPMFEPRTARSRRALARRSASSALLRSEMSWRIAMAYAGLPAASRWSETETWPQTSEPSLRRVALFQRETGRLAPHEREELLEAGRQILGIRDVPEGSCEQLRAGVADDVAKLLIDSEEAAFAIRVGDADGRVLERAAEPRLALAQRLLGPLALGDVAGDAREAEGAAAGVSMGDDHLGDRDLPAIMAEHGGLPSPGAVADRGGDTLLLDDPVGPVGEATGDWPVPELRRPPAGRGPGGPPG